MEYYEKLSEFPKITVLISNQSFKGVYQFFSKHFTQYKLGNIS